MRFRRSSSEVRLEMTPLIDVVFLLLTFFIFSLVLMVRADVLEIDLPTLGSGDSAEPGRYVTLAIDEAGEILLNGEPIEMTEVLEGVESAMQVSETDTPPSLVIAVDVASQSGRLIEIADLLAGGGFGNFSIVGRTADPGNNPPPSPDLLP